MKTQKKLRPIPVNCDQMYSNCLGKFLKIFFLLVVTAVISLFIIGCSESPTIQGKVTNIYGKPIQNVEVSVRGTTFTTKTNKTGDYSVPFVPGEFSVDYKLLSYQPKSIHLKISHSTKYPASTIILEPSNVCVLNEGEKSLKSLKPAQVEYTKNGGLAITGEVNFFSQDSISLFIFNDIHKYFILKDLKWDYYHDMGLSA